LVPRTSASAKDCISALYIVFARRVFRHPHDRRCALRKNRTLISLNPGHQFH
jgi:hypothetical protein